MRIRIEGFDLPGRVGDDHTDPLPSSDPLRFGDVSVGVQRRGEVVDRVRADADAAVWHLDVTSRDVGGLLDVGGPYVHGRPGARFLYLTWSAGDVMFRRAKLLFADIPTALLRAGHDDGVLLVARLGLTGDDGTPRCARVRPPAVTWRAG